LDTAEARAEAALRRDATLEAVAFAAQRFLQGSGWESVVPSFLRRLGEATGASRVYLFENEIERDELRTRLRGQWVADGVRSFVEEGTSLGFAGLERWVATLGRGDVVNGRVADFAPSERERLERHEIRSIVLAPISVAGGWWGYLGFDDCDLERAWTQIEIDTLRAAAGIVGAAVERERSERQLREAEARYREIVERTPAVTYQEHATETYSVATAVTYMSPQIERILGYPPQRWLEIPGFWSQIVHPDDLERVNAESERTARTGEPYSQEYRLIAADGRVVWFRDDAVLIRDGDGRPTWHGVMVDVTERRVVEDRMREAEARFRDLVESIPAVTYRESLGGDPELFYVSPQVEAAFGYRPEEWTWTPNFWFDHIHPDDLDRVKELDRTTNETGAPFATEYRLRRADGTYVWIHDQATLVGPEDGRRFWQGFMLDVTERREAEAALAEAEARYRTLVEQVPVVIYTQAIDREDPRVSNTVYIGPRTEDMLGYTVEETLETGGLWRDVLHPDDRERVLAGDARSNETGEDFVMEYRMIAQDGHVVWVHDEATVVRDHDGRPRAWQGFLLDITERKEAEDRLEQALEVEREAGRRLRSLDEMKNTFLQAVSHDLRTPLAAILGLAVTLERTDIELPPAEARDLASRIAANARRLDRLVTDLLDLDRLARGIVEPKLHPTELGALVARVVEGSDLQAHRRVDLELAEIVIRIDAAKVERIVENLLANALRHTSADTAIRVAVQPLEAGALLIVEDEGTGVPEEIRETIFDPFRQGPDAPEHSPGVGVGLTLVRRFAELHGGRAWVQERTGGGASFRVFLPEASTG
jgi:PAS domain S-box-containing protein